MKPVISWIVTILVWFLIYWWECASGAFLSKFFLSQFVLTWIYLLSASILVLPYESKELHNKVFGGRLFTLSPGFYFIPLIMWWGKVHTITQVSNVEERNFIHLDTREIAGAVKDYANRKVDRQRELKGFWGALEDFLRQYWSGKDIKDSLWIGVITFFLAWFLSIYFLKFNKEYFPKNFASKERRISASVINSSNPPTSQTVDHQKVMKNYVDSARATISDAEYYGDTTTRATVDVVDDYEKDPATVVNPTPQAKKVRHKRESPPEGYITPSERRKIRDGSKNFDVVRYVQNTDFVFIPHIILRGYPPEHVSRFLLPGYTLQGFYPEDGRYVITNSFGSRIDETECFRFIFYYQGKAFWSDSKKPYEGEIFPGLEEGMASSNNIALCSYIINGRIFEVVDGSATKHDPGK